MYPSLMMLYSVCLLSNCGSTIQVISQAELNIRQSLCSCIVEASKRYFSTDFETLTFPLPLVEVNKDLSSPVVVNQLVLPILEAEQRWALLIQNLSHPIQNIHKHSKKSNSYIIQLRREDEFRENIVQLKKLTSWNPHAKFLVVSLTVFPNPRAVVADVIRYLWENNVVNVAVLLSDAQNRTVFQAYAWEPYSNLNCGNNFSYMQLVGSCSHGSMQNRKSWFGTKMRKPLHNCSVKVNYVIWPPFVMDQDGFQVTNYYKNQGIEINLLNMIAAALDMHVIYNKSAYEGWGVVSEEGAGTKDLGLLLSNEIDIVIGSYTNRIPMPTYLDYSRSYIQDSLVWCVPHKPIVIGFKSMLNILGKKVWVCIFLTYFIITFLIWFASCGTAELAPFKRFLYCLQLTFSVVIGVATHVLPRTNKVRYLVTLLIFFSMHLDLFYTSYLTSILSRPRYREKYASMEDIYQNNLKTYFVSKSNMFFEDENWKNVTINQIKLDVLKQRWEQCTDARSCLHYVALRQDSALCTSNLKKEYLFNNVDEIKKIKSAIYCSKERVVTFPVNMIMRKGFPFFHLFDQVLDRIVGAGFVAKWEKDSLEDRSKRAGHDETESFKWKDLRPLFLMLTIAQSIAGLVFLAEIFWQRNQLFGLGW